MSLLKIIKVQKGKHFGQMAQMGKKSRFIMQ